MGHWNPVWKALGAAMAGVPDEWQLVLVLGGGLLGFAALEGLHVLFWPRRALKMLAERYPAASVLPQPEPDDLEYNSLPAPKHQPVSMGAPRRWQRPQPARPGRRTARQPQR